MKCPNCEKEGKKSRIYPGMCMSTCMGTSEYYDENGNYHIHDPNTSTTRYSCSNGHIWQESSKSKCPICDH